ncbi:MAG: hypothetical protein WBM71_02435, partial [Sedimenticolaceae bacterium]
HRAGGIKRHAIAYGPVLRRGRGRRSGLDEQSADNPSRNAGMRGTDCAPALAACEAAAPVLEHIIVAVPIQPIDATHWLNRPY